MIHSSFKLYCALLQLYPPRFREEYASQMAQCFRDRYREAEKKGGPACIFAVWLWALPDLVASLIQEHIESRKPRKVMMNAIPAAIDRYQLKARIGEGSVSSVFRAFDPERGAEVAIKLLKANDDLAPGSYAHWQEHLQREANVLTALDHPAIPKVYQHAQTQSGDYLVMEMIEGRSPLQIMESCEGFLEEGAIIQWGIQTCEVLNYLHTSQPEPLLFRDVKPSNMIVDEGGRFHLVDFGTSVPYIAGHTYEGIGTEGYAAPEQYQGHEEIRSDLYALGAALHHLATRIDPREETKHRPFTFAPPRSINPALSKPFAAVIQQALAYEPEDRFPNAANMRAALEACR